MPSMKTIIALLHIILIIYFYVIGFKLAWKISKFKGNPIFLYVIHALLSWAYAAWQLEVEKS